MTKSQTYAKIEKKPVILKTPMSAILRVSPSGSAVTHTAMMMKRLKAAEPTMVDGPRSPEKKSAPTISMIDSNISGADEPSAMSVRLATVAFQTLTGTSTPSLPFIIFSLDVITSIAAMKMSAMMPTPRNIHRSKKR